MKPTPNITSYLRNLIVELGRVLKKLKKSENKMKNGTWKQKINFLNIELNEFEFYEKLNYILKLECSKIISIYSNMNTPANMIEIIRDTEKYCLQYSITFLSNSEHYEIFLSYWIYKY